MEIEKFKTGILIGGVTAVLFGILHLTHSMLFSRVCNLFLLSAILNGSKEDAVILGIIFESLNIVIYIFLIIMMLITFMLIIVCYKKNGIHFLKKGTIKTRLAISTSLILCGSLILFLIGFTGFGLHTIINSFCWIIGGIIMINS